MAFSFSRGSLKHLEGVHPDLQRVAKRAIKYTTIDFGITEGARSQQTQQQYLDAGKSQTLHSKHLIQDTGYAHAIDIVAWVDGSPNWQNGAQKGQPDNYGPIIQAFITASMLEADEGRPVYLEFGHLWQGFRDSVHIQLNSRFH